MRAAHASIEDHHEPERYEICIKGHLDDKWADWFEGLTITLPERRPTAFVPAFRIRGEGLV